MEVIAIALLLGEGESHICMSFVKEREGMYSFDSAYLSREPVLLSAEVSTSGLSLPYSVTTNTVT